MNTTKATIEKITSYISNLAGFPIKNLEASWEEYTGKHHICEEAFNMWNKDRAYEEYKENVHLYNGYKIKFSFDSEWLTNEELIALMEKYNCLKSGAEWYEDDLKMLRENGGSMEYKRQWIFHFDLDILKDSTDNTHPKYVWGWKETDTFLATNDSTFDDEEYQPAENDPEFESKSKLIFALDRAELIFHDIAPENAIEIAHMIIDR